MPKQGLWGGTFCHLSKCKVPEGHHASGVRDNKGLCGRSRWKGGSHLTSGGGWETPTLMEPGSLCMGQGGVLSRGKILVSWAG